MNTDSRQPQCAPAGKGFWDLFGHDSAKNCLAWRHSVRNPVIPAAGESWKKFWTANPDVLEFAGRRLVYYRGNGLMAGGDGARHDRIAVAEILGLGRDTIETRDLNDGAPILDVGAPGTFDGRHVLDPATVVFRGEVWLYYSAIGPGADSVGLARSADGIHFKKIGKVLEGRAPDVVVRDDGISMLYQLPNAKGHYEIFLAHSRDGMRFEPLSDSPVFSPATSGWDSRDVVTGRLLCAGNEFYLFYGGSSTLIDQPASFGLARSRDLIHWERHPGNPVFCCGPKGSEDAGAIWFPALMETEGEFVLLYEGSRGNYGGDLSSQICMASIAKNSLRHRSGDKATRATAHGMHGRIKAFAASRKEVASLGPDGYVIAAEPGNPELHVAGQSDSGVVAGVGRLMREIRYRQGAIEVPALQIVESGRYKTR